MYGIDITLDGRVLVSAEESGRVVATDVTTKLTLWSQIMGANRSIGTLRIYKDVVVVPVHKQQVHVLDVLTGAMLHTYAALSGYTFGLILIPGLAAMV